LIRQRKDINQKTIAAKVGVKPSMLSMALRGQRKCSIDLLVSVAEACGTSIGEIEQQIKADQAAETSANTIKEETARYNPPKVIDLDHEEIITRFKDKETARMVNSMLVEIEASDQEHYEIICDMIKTMYSKVRRRKREGPANGKSVVGE